VRDTAQRIRHDL